MKWECIKIKKEHLFEVVLLHRLVFLETYSNILSESYLDGMKIDTLLKYWTKLLNSNDADYQLITHKGFAIGFYTIIESRLKNHAIKELGSIYLLKEFQGVGIGKAVFTKIKKGNHQFVIVVLAENKKANKFYISQGCRLLETRSTSYGNNYKEENVYLYDKFFTG